MSEKLNTLNLAALTLGERQLINADLMACKLRHEMTAKTMAISEWQGFVRAELAKLDPEQAELVKTALKVRAGK